ncbi:hypothetical protein TVAG_285460 [Trichomonas vaginalis G3]|uniref:Leucine Rich Repeat family protein n=1 Tax=Trichomonas vaginalis (strain ATCC PRA-98 / G3) TaxID=412133 RepID=A2FUA4_TRIV3|nr:L domain-like family [Trichomonas vaginalis G3]EAX91494.1 hypothetical protein TVAG_285460 [Trichomonas vaginalis G3]KAI5485048.1 L domain-like family [Trichomonas vaginalis G3]|eukprot:XP_001304424.1 hypothetical protein [Trichomonas vaginalis G3]
MQKGYGLSPIPKGLLLQDYSNEGLTTLADLDLSPTLITLNLTNNPLKTLESLRTIPTLAKLVLDNTNIDSLLGVRPQPSLSNLSALSCPLSDYEYLAMMCTIVFGDNIMQINNQQVNENDKLAGREARSHLKPYLLQGWIIVSTIPLVLKHVTSGEILPLSDTYKITPVDPEILEQTREVPIGVTKIEILPVQIQNPFKLLKMNQLEPFIQKIIHKLNYQKLFQDFGVQKMIQTNQ